MPDVFRILAQAIGAESCSPGFRGCPFINAAAEYADPEHPVRRVVDAHRRWFKQTIQDLLDEISIPDSARVADQLVMLRDGALVSGYLSDPSTLADALCNAGPRPDRIQLRVLTPASIRPEPLDHLVPVASEMWNIHVYTASSAGAKCARLGGGGIGEHEASAVTGGGGIEEQVTAVCGGGGTDEQDARAVAGGGGIAEHEASAVCGGGGIAEHEASAVTGVGGIGEHEASAVTGGGGIDEQPCAVLGGGGISDPERAGRRARADAASLAPDSISL